MCICWCVKLQNPRYNDKDYHMFVQNLLITNAYLQYIRRTFDKDYHMFVQNL